MPHWTHLFSSRTEMPFFKAMACCLQYSMQVPHPVQSPGMRSGRICPRTPMSFKQERTGAEVPGTSIVPIDVTPVSDLDQGDYHRIALDGEDRSILPNTKRVQGTA